MTIDFNRYYQDIENGVSKEDVMAVIQKVEAYNKHVTALSVMINRIIFRDPSKPLPETFQWVYIRKKKSVTWPLWTGKDFSINLVFDGELVAVNSAGDLIKDLNVILRPIKDLSDMMQIEYKGSVCTLEDLYNSVADKKDFFGIEFNSYWPKKADYNQ
jgi:hypothetical protein